MPLERITIVSLYRAEMAETFVGAVVGSLTDSERQQLADAFDAVYWGHAGDGRADDVDDDEDTDQMYFQEVALELRAADLRTLLNQSDYHAEPAGQSR